MTDDKSSSAGMSTRNPRGKYITLVVLVLWVAAIFVFTLFKFSGIRN